MRKIEIGLILVGLWMMAGQEVKAMLYPFPKVLGVSPVEVKPGSVISLTGQNFSYEGVDKPCNTETIKDGVCPWKTVIAAYKAPRRHDAYQGSKPDFRLKIVSLSENLIQAQVPEKVGSGDGVYNLGLFLEYDPVVGAVQAAQLVGLARYDSLNLSGAGAGASGAMVTKKVEASSTVQPTKVGPTRTQVTGVEIKKENIKPKETTKAEKKRLGEELWKKIEVYFKWFFVDKIGKN